MRRTVFTLAAASLGLLEGRDETFSHPVTAPRNALEASRGRPDATRCARSNVIGQPVESPGAAR